MWGVWFYLAAAAVLISRVESAARLVCYVEDSPRQLTECTHLVYSGAARGDKLDALLKEYRKNNPRAKIVLRVSEVDKDPRTLLKSKNVQGLEIHDAHKTLNRTKVLETVEAARTAISSSGGGPLFLALPAHPELLAKYYDLRALMKKVDFMMVQTHALGKVKKMTYHPSRLSGLWDMMNTDSVVDLAVGLGVPASKIVISLPATAQQFTLKNETLSTPGSPTEEDEPKEIGQDDLCRQLQKGRWTLERDQDLSAPYAFKDQTWIAFEDASSVDVKGKYARVRGLAGLALHRADRDVDTPCGPTLRTSLAKVLNQQSRAPRAVILRSLENEILAAPSHARALDALQVSPYRITQIVDSDGVIHSIREDTRTEFSCSRQGYFVHPRSCARFYRCVKFDQLSPEYTVFEFDCPAGLAFDSRYEVCVWPGSLPDSQACPGSSEIAPVPKTRFICPEHEGYYADPENCRWFFACLDHGKAPLTAYEFRCPFGLGFDAEKLKCDWPWLVPACGNIARYEAEVHGYSGAYLTGAAGFQGQTADSINIAAHQSLVSGASVNNLVGIQNGFLTKGDALDSNFIASQELANGANQYQLSQGSQGSNGLAYQVGSADNLGLVQATKYNDDQKYTSGSLILDDYRLPTKNANAQHAATHSGYSESYAAANLGQTNGNYNAYSTSSISGNAKQTNGYQSSDYDAENSGAYVHDPTGDYAEPYKHVDSPGEPYIHQDAGYQSSSDYYDYGKYKASSQSTYNENSGQYVHDNSGSYVDGSAEYREGVNGYKSDYTGSYNTDYSGSYTQDNSGQYVAGVYRTDSHIGDNAARVQSANVQGYSQANSGNYISDSKAYTGSSHTLTAGAVNVGLVGKTTLVDAEYSNQNNYQGANGYYQSVAHETYPGHVKIVSQPAVSIKHVGTDEGNLDGYSFVTTPTSSGVPTTATPFAFTTAVPTVTYKTTFVPEAPKSTIKQIFGFSQPAVTTVQPAVIAVQHYVTPKVQVTNYNQGQNYQYESKDYLSANSQSQSETVKESKGYDYSKPSIKFEEGISYTTAAPAITVSKFEPKGFSHSQQTNHNVESVGYQYSTPVPVTEEPFKKIVAYTTGPSVTSFAQPTAASYPQANSHQTIQKVEASNVHVPSVVQQVAYEQPQPVLHYTTAAPAIAVQPVVPTYQPQIFNQQTYHKVDATRVNTYTQDSSSGYKYEKPAAQFEEGQTVQTFSTPAPTVVQYSTPAPAVVSTYKPQAYSHQVLHQFESKPVVSSTVVPIVQYEAQPTPVTIYENPIIQYTQPKITPVTYVKPTYNAQSFSHQTLHKVEDSKVYTPSVNAGYEYKSTLSYEQPKTVVQYTTSQPAIAIQPAVSTYQPQVVSHQTYHQVNADQIKTYSKAESGYQYIKPELKFEEVPQTVTYSTPAPAVVSTYKPKSYSQQTVHKIQSNTYLPPSSTPQPTVDFASNYQEQKVSTYQNPILTYTQKITPVTYVKPSTTVFKQTYQPVVQQHQVSHEQSNQYQGAKQYYEQNIQYNEGYAYNQPEIQDNVETAQKSYSDASVVSHQHFHLDTNNNYDSGKDVVFVSTTPATLAYEDHYSEYETAKKVQGYKAPEYIPPKTDYQQTYSVVSTAAPVVQQTFVEQNVQPIDYSQQYEYEAAQKSVPVQQVSFSTSHVSQPKRVESIHLSSFPGTKVTTKYQKTTYDNPEIQVQYKAEEYLPPVVSTTTEVPVVISTYKPRTYSTTTREYLPPSTTRKYLPPAQPEYKNREYLPPVETKKYFTPSTTSKPITTTTYKASEYLPPAEEKVPNVVNFESFGYNNVEASSIGYNPYQEVVSEEVTAKPYRKPNIVVETAKSNLLGFGTVGPDAGLVSPVTYTTAAPIEISSTYRPIVKSTTQEPIYKYSESTTYKAPEYLPPSGESYREQNSQDDYNTYQQNVEVSTFAPIKRKQNIVVQTAKANALGYGAVDAGLVSSVRYSDVSSTESYTAAPHTVTSTYAPVEQGLFEVTPSQAPRRRTKPKVAVVTKINDFNPLLVRKLGAVCSCQSQSPVLVLRGTKINKPTPVDFDDYNNDYEDGRGDINDNEWAQKTVKLQSPTVTATPIITTSVNPIIVPEDSYYQDYQDQSNYNIAVTPKTAEDYVSSTPVVTSTERLVRIRPRVKAVTVAPTYKTVLLDQEVAPTPEVVVSNEESQTFDRYGPGGWRSRDETLQGSVDCKRAGLFRHPKQCNKFYACRWDCTKQRFTLHVFNCPVQLSFDPSIGACNWPSQGPACQGDTLLTNTL